MTDKRIAPSIWNVARAKVQCHRPRETGLLFSVAGKPPEKENKEVNGCVLLPEENCRAPVINMQKPVWQRIAPVENIFSEEECCHSNKRYGSFGGRVRDPVKNTGTIKRARDGTIVRIRDGTHVRKMYGTELHFSGGTDLGSRERQPNNRF